MDGLIQEFLGQIVIACFTIICALVAAIGKHMDKRFDKIDVSRNDMEIRLTSKMDESQREVRRELTQVRDRVSRVEGFMKNPPHIPNHD